MEEKVIIKGHFYNSIVLLLIGFFPVLAIVLGRIIADPSFDVPGFILIGLGGAFVIAFIVTRSCEIVVTDKRIYGKAIFGKRVDLPMDSVSAVGSNVFLRGISVATSAGSIKFALVKNSNEVQDAISGLLINRQNKTRHANIITQEAQSSADELKKYKELLDNGVISQEEFDAKKKQLLGL